MLVGILIKALQCMVAVQDQRLMNEHVLGEIEKHLDDDAKQELDQHIDKMTDNSFRSLKDMFG